jgi:hypothetical protein
VPVFVGSVRVQKRDALSTISEIVLEPDKGLKEAGIEALQTTAPALRPVMRQSTANPLQALPQGLQEKQLVILFFDLSSMQSDEVARAVESAKKFITDQMQPSTLVAVVSHSAAIATIQDFTSDKGRLAYFCLERAGAQREGQGPSGWTSISSIASRYSSCRVDAGTVKDGTGKKTREICRRSKRDGHSGGDFELPGLRYWLRPETR